MEVGLSPYNWRPINVYVFFFFNQNEIFLNILAKIVITLMQSQ